MMGRCRPTEKSIVHTKKFVTNKIKMRNIPFLRIKIYSTERK